MTAKTLTIGMTVKHPQYGIGVVKALTENTADIRFDDGSRTIDPELGELSPAESFAAISDLEIPLETLIEAVAKKAFQQFKTEQPEVTELGERWNGGKLVLHPSNSSLQPKEIPIETFFHKIIAVRNQLRVLEAKLNGHSTMTDGEKVELQQYISRSYGALTSFNVLFAEKEDQFSSK
ncbi:MAG: hypothetical protein ACKVJX_14375 [Verrucomicrobiia bacterium]|jgi:hypothetical protein